MFLRFAVCSLACSWCDTDFSPEGAEKLTKGEIVSRLSALDANASRMVVVTGGEPALQWDEPLATALRDAGFRVHMESNGTRTLAAPVDWLTVSPKPRFHGPRDALAGGLPASEVKVVVDGTVGDDDLARYEELYACDSRFLQPCMDERYEAHLAETLELLQRHPRWRLSLQLHKIVGVP